MFDLYSRALMIRWLSLDSLPSIYIIYFAGALLPSQPRPVLPSAARILPLLPSVPPTAPALPSHPSVPLTLAISITVHIINVTREAVHFIRMPRPPLAITFHCSYLPLLLTCQCRLSLITAILDCFPCIALPHIILILCRMDCLWSFIWSFSARYSYCLHMDNGSKEYCTPMCKWQHLLMILMLWYRYF